MKKNYILLLAISIIISLVLFTGCDFSPKPEFYLDGKPYYSSTYFVESHSEEKLGYHYGMSFNQKTQKKCKNFT